MVERTFALRMWFGEGLGNDAREIQTELRSSNNNYSSLVLFFDFIFYMNVYS